MCPLVLHRQEFWGRMNEAASTGIESLGAAYRAPRMHAVRERFLGSIRRECLDHLLILSQAPLRRAVHTCVSCFNEQRPCQGSAQQIPAPGQPSPAEPVCEGRVEVLPILGGLRHASRRAA